VDYAEGNFPSLQPDGYFEQNDLIFFRPVTCTSGICKTGGGGEQRRMMGGIKSFRQKLKLPIKNI
jgi:hypothetical protein